MLLCWVLLLLDIRTSMVDVLLYCRCATIELLYRAAMIRYYRCLWFARPRVSTLRVVAVHLLLIAILTLALYIRIQ